TEEGLTHAGLRAAGFFVPVMEAGLPVPDGPADPGCIGRFTEGLIVMCSRGAIGRGETTEFTDVDGPAEVFGPLTCLVDGSKKSPAAAWVRSRGLGVVRLQPIEDRGTELERWVGNQRLQWRSREEYAGQLGVGAGPGGALVGEVEGVVVVHRHDQVFV